MRLTSHYVQKVNRIVTLRDATIRPKRQYIPFIKTAPRSQFNCQSKPLF